MGKKVAVIGGGLGGLSAAVRLANRGFDVELFERNDRLGGKMNRFEDQGFQFDTGPSLLTMPFVVDDLFQFIGKKREDYLTFEPIDPVCRYFWEDGASLDTSTETDRMRPEIAKLSPKDAEQYEAFMNYGKRIYDLTADIFLYSAIHEPNKVINWKNFMTLFRAYQIDPMRTAHQGVSRFFKHPRIIQLFDRYATYNGSNPYQAPATLNIIPYVEYGLGSFYIKGGMFQLVTVLEKLACENGVNISTSAHVERILQQNKQVIGVQVNGEKISADYVISNADVVVAYNELIDGFEKKRKKLNRFEPSLSGLVFLWGVKGEYDQLAHHNIIFPNDYAPEFESIFKEKQAPDDPTIYIAISSKTDKAHAPKGHENWFVLLNMPYLAEGQQWDDIVNRMRNFVLDKLKSNGLDVTDKVETEKVFTPQDFYDYYRSNRGSIYGIASNNKTTAFRRPANRSREIKGLYFVGGSTHPGGGVPLVMLSGKLSADLILEKEKK